MKAVGPADGTILWLALDPSIFLPGLYLAGALVVGAAVVAIVQRWRKRALPANNPSGQLAHFRALYERGTISQEEFNRLRSLLGGQLRQAFDVPLPPPTSPGKSGASSDQVRPADANGLPRPERSEEGRDKGPSDTGIRPG